MIVPLLTLIAGVALVWAASGFKGKAQHRGER